MKKIILLLSLIILVSCAQEVDPTVNNMNDIFDSKDFTIEFVLDDSRTESMSFIEDIIVYKTAKETKRSTITFDEALLINDFIQSQFKLHDASNSEIPSIIILNTAKKVTLKIPKYEAAYSNLITKLEL
ncbi:MAG: hypothetical protein ABF247_13685 [Nonlabens sp.]|uniref:hypothetical protein n=2 Tax=Nonlabens sp. TaxID=1888209 RepID=UPI00321B6EAA